MNNNEAILCSQLTLIWTVGMGVGIELNIMLFAMIVIMILKN